MEKDSGEGAEGQRTKNVGRGRISNRRGKRKQGHLWETWRRTMEREVKDRGLRMWAEGASAADTIEGILSTTRREETRSFVGDMKKDSGEGSEGQKTKNVGRGSISSRR